MGVVAYKIKRRGEVKPLIIMVRSSDAAVGSITRFSTLSAIRKIAEDFEKVLAPVTAVAEALLEAVKKRLHVRSSLNSGSNLAEKSGYPLLRRERARPTSRCS